MAGSSSRVMDRSYIVLRLDGDAAFSSLSPMGGATLVSLSDGRGGGTLASLSKGGTPIINVRRFTHAGLAFDDAVVGGL